MKIANISREILHNVWTTWAISLKFSGKVCLMIILKFTQNQGFTLCLEDTIFKKPQGGVKLTPPPPLSLPSRFRVNISSNKWMSEKLFKVILSFFSLKSCTLIALPIYLPWVFRFVIFLCFPFGNAFFHKNLMTTLQIPSEFYILISLGDSFHLFIQFDQHETKSPNNKS